MERKEGLCTTCGKELVIPQPPHEIINTELVSMVVMPHPERVTCPNCFQPYLFYITKLRGVEYGWKAIKRSEDELNIITPPKRIIM
jgi:hypothetical protein